jgi:uncharacterized membrane protein
MGLTTMTLLTVLDLIAIAGFTLAWGAYAFLVERAGQGRGGLNNRMDAFREDWMRCMLARDNRMVDMQIMAALQNGTAFFASASLIAIGGALTLTRSTDDMIALAVYLPFATPDSRAAWEVKTIGLCVIFVYAFFKFAWSYRLYNYVAIMLGATPAATEKETLAAENHIRRTARLFTTAGRQFNRGQRAFFFALAYLGWFAGPFALMITTGAVVVVMWRRQFASDSFYAVVNDKP